MKVFAEMLFIGSYRSLVVVMRIMSVFFDYLAPLVVVLDLSWRRKRMSLRLAILVEIRFFTLLFIEVEGLVVRALLELRFLLVETCYSYSSLASVIWIGCLDCCLL